MNIYKFLHAKISHIDNKEVIMLQFVTALYNHEKVIIMIKKNFDQIHLKLYISNINNIISEFSSSETKLILKHIKELVTTHQLGFLAVVMLDKNDFALFEYFIIHYNMIVYTFSSSYDENHDYLLVKYCIYDDSIDFDSFVDNWKIGLEILEEMKVKYKILEPTPFVLQKQIARKEKLQELKRRIKSKL